MTLSQSNQDLLRQADEALSRGALKEASQKYEEFLVKEPDWPEAHHKLGCTYARRGRHPRAIEELEKAVRFGIDTATIHRELAKSYRARNETELALDHAKKALQLEPDSAECYVLVAQLLEDLKDYAQAVVYYHSALDRSPGFVDACLGLAQVLERQERPEEALTELVKVLQLFPADDRIWEMLERLFKISDCKTAHRKKIPRKLRGDPYGWLHWGQTLLASDDKVNASSALTKAMELACKVEENLDTQADINPEERKTKLNDIIWYVIYPAWSQLYSSLSDSRNRKALEDKITTIIQLFEDATLCLSCIQDMKSEERADRALSLTVTGLEHFHKPDEVDCILSWIDENLPNNAVTTLNAVVEKLGDDYATLAWARKLMTNFHRYRDAESILKIAAEQRKVIPAIHWELALTYARQHKHKVAFAALTQALNQWVHQKDIYIDISLEEMVPVILEDPVVRIQRVDELVTKLNEGFYFANWAEALTKLGEHDRALIQLFTAVKGGYEVSDKELQDVLFGNEEDKRESWHVLVDQWLDFIRERNDRKSLIQLGRVLKEHDNERALSYVHEAIKGLNSTDKLWISAGDAFVELDAPADAVSCYSCYLTEHSAEVQFSLSMFLQRWAEALMSADKLDSSTGHRALLVHALKDWTDDEQFNDKSPELDWDELQKRRAAQVSRIDKLVETVVRDVDSEWICSSVANILYNNREYEAAIRILRHATDLDNRDVSVASLAGWSLLQINRLSEARSEFRRALNQEEGWSAYYGMAQVALRLRDFKEANRCYMRALELCHEDQSLISDIYENWAWTLTCAGEMDEALEKAERSLEADDDMWSNFRLGYICSNMGLNEKGINYYESAIKRDDHPYPRHNIASLYQSCTEYETARKLWGDACTVYHRRLVEMVTARVAEYLRYYGQAHAGMLGNRSVAEMLYRIGLQLDPTDTLMLSKLGSLYMENSKRAKDFQMRSHFRRLSKQTWKKAEAILRDRQERDADVETLIQLGNLYLDMADNKRARETFCKALEIWNRDFRILAGLGEVYRRDRRYSLAIDYLKRAVAEETEGFDAQIKLARVYLENVQLDAAEAGFQEMLDRNKNHFDARVGLGEVYIAMAEACKKESEAEAESDYWRRAQDELNRAVAIAKSSERPKDISEQERAPIHYLLGYCYVNQYRVASRETPLRFSLRYLLRDAQEEFSKCKQLDSTHYKAERAFDKLRRSARLLPRNRLLDVLGPILVGIAALVLFVMAHVAKFKGWEETPRAGFRLTDKILATIPRSPQQGEIAVLEGVEKLKPAFGKTFANDDALLAHLTELVGQEWVNRYGEALVKAAFVPPGPPKHKCLSDGYYVLLSLGAVLFLIAGLCLPYLTSLKVGALQLEKTAVEEVGAGGALGITVERMTTQPEK